MTGIGGSFSAYGLLTLRKATLSRKNNCWILNAGFWNALCELRVTIRNRKGLSPGFIGFDSPIRNEHIQPGSQPGGARLIHRIHQRFLAVE